MKRAPAPVPGINLETITIDNTGNASTLTQYPVKIELTSSNFDFSKADWNGADIRILDSDGATVVPHYIRSWNNVAKTAEVWARVDSIPGSGSKTLYLKSGYSSAPFTIPPTGKFTRPTASIDTGLAENMVYDSVTAKYYVVTCDTPSGPISLYSSTVPSGGTWTDEGIILNLGTAGQWDDGVVYAPHLVKDASTWYLFYSGGPDTNENSHSVGYATAASVTGAYARYGSNPVLSYSGAADWEQYRACEPYVYYSSILSKWVMFYMGDSGSGTGSQIEKVGYATADTITGTWTKYASNPVISFVAGPDWRDRSIAADPFVLEIGAVAYVYITGGNPYTIGVFKTADYITFTEIGQVFGTGPAGRFDGDSAFRGAISRFDDTYYMPFTGVNGGAYAWAVATMPALSTAKGFDPLQVFDYFDDFNGSSLDADLWTSVAGSTSGTVTVSGGVAAIAITSGAGAHRTLSGHREFGIGYMLEAYTRHSSATSGGTNAGEVGFADELDRNPVARIWQYNTASAKKENTTAAGASTVSDMPQALSTDWVIRRIAWIASNSFGFQNDANAWETIGTNTPDYVMKPWAFAYRGSVNVSYELDWLIVRKYANPEPSTSIG